MELGGGGRKEFQGKKVSIIYRNDETSWSEKLKREREEAAKRIIYCK